MKKIVIFIVLISFSSHLFSQEIFKASECEISFFSEAPMENIEATNKEGKALLNTKTNELVFITSIIGFKFKKSLMEEHFNENYLESNKYKTAYFKGVITTPIDFYVDGIYPTTVKGILNIHGVDVEREIEGTITIKNGVIDLKSTFNVSLKDHHIEIPKIVIKNIAEKVSVKIQATLLPKNN